MTLYSGQPYLDKEVSLRAPDPDLVHQAPKSRDVQGPVDYWLSEAMIRDDIFYFSIFAKESLAGQILLHDMDPDTGERLVAYHLFEPRRRGQGTGTRALRLLQDFVKAETPLKELVIITSRDNLASQRIAQKCGFTYAGAPREDPINGVVFTWNLQD